MPITDWTKIDPHRWYWFGSTKSHSRPWYWVFKFVVAEHEVRVVRPFDCTTLHQAPTLQEAFDWMKSCYGVRLIVKLDIRLTIGKIGVS